MGKIVTQKVYGEAELEEALQKLKDRGINPNVSFSGTSKHGSAFYTLIYEEINILNEG